MEVNKNIWLPFQNVCVSPIWGVMSETDYTLYAQNACAHGLFNLFVQTDPHMPALIKSDQFVLFMSLSHAPPAPHPPSYL